MFLLQFSEGSKDFKRLTVRDILNLSDCTKCNATSTDIAGFKKQDFVRLLPLFIKYNKNNLPKSTIFNFAFGIKIDLF